MTTHYEIIGACGPFGCAPPGQVAPFAFNNPYYQGGGFPGAYGGGYGGGGYGNLAIVGQAAPAPYYGLQTVDTPAPPATQMQPTGAGAAAGTDDRTYMQKTSDWLNTEGLFGWKNKNTLLLATVAGLGVYGYSAGWLSGAASDVDDDGRDRSHGRMRHHRGMMRDHRRGGGGGGLFGGGSSNHRRSSSRGRDFFSF